MGGHQSLQKKQFIIHNNKQMTMMISTREKLTSIIGCTRSEEDINAKLIKKGNTKSVDKRPHTIIFSDNKLIFIIKYLRL